jgi:hypothetical protein
LACSARGLWGWTGRRRAGELNAGALKGNGDFRFGGLSGFLSVGRPGFGGLSGFLSVGSPGFGGLSGFLSFISRFRRTG